MSKQREVLDLTSTAKKRKKLSKIKSFFSVVVPSKKKLERELATAKFEKEIEDQKDGKKEQRDARSQNR